jgi:hypothetical protein
MLCCEILETFDPMRLEHSMASFLYVNGSFIAVPFQSHLDALGASAGVAVPGFGNDGQQRMEVYDQLNAYAAQNGIVQGGFTPGGRHLKTSMTLRGTLAACRKAFAAFRASYPDLIADLSAVSYDILAQDGTRIDSGFIEDAQIDRKFGRRG